MPTLAEIAERVEAYLTKAPLRDQVGPLFTDPQVLGWGAARDQPRNIELSASSWGGDAPLHLTLFTVAQLSGIPVFRANWPFTSLPNLAQRRAVYKALSPSHFEHLLCYVTSDDQQAAFVWARSHSGKTELRTLPYEVGAPARTTLDQLSKLAFTYPELGLFGEPPITAVLDKLNAAFDVEAVTQSFFSEYDAVFRKTQQQISSLTDDALNIFTQRLFNRLMFIIFLERKGWLKFNGRKDYLRTLWADHLRKKAVQPDLNFYLDRLHPLFFSALNTRHNVNIMESNDGWFLRPIVGDVPYLNGGLFDEEPEDGQAGVPDEAIEPILTRLLYRFNFTITESSPLNVEVAVDPEMLGKVFERLVTGRHNTGSYYTPKPIVSFMCREALKRYLTEALPNETPIAVAAFVEEHNSSTLRDPEAVLAALKKVTACDPACGSGAYLLGMLHELVDLRASLFDRKVLDAPTIYDRKLQIIEENIYGVDIDEFAVNIARLRLWLSLSVEFDGAKPLPLPNLNFKIMKGDSLTSPDPSQGAKPDLIRHMLLQEFAGLRRVYSGKGSGEKQSLFRQIADLRTQIVASTDTRYRSAEFDWSIDFCEIFESRNPEDRGFDIVLANPPYGAEVGDNVRDLYFSRATDGAQSKDTYGLFIARGIQMLHQGGQLCYITSDTWRTIRTHKPLRKMVLDKTTLSHILDLPAWIFDATVNTCIFTLTKHSASKSHTLIAGDLRPIPNNDWQTLTANLLAVAGNSEDKQTMNYARYTYPQRLIQTYENLSIFIGSPKLHSLMSDQRFTKLGQIAEVKVGLQTGDNEYYLRKQTGARGRYQLLDETKLLSSNELASLTEDEKQNGIPPNRYGGRHYIPYDKGGESDADGGWLPNYYVPTQYFINWSRASVQRLKTYCEDPRTLRGKAVIRNPDYYFKQGITFSDTGFYAPTFRFGSVSVFDVMGMTIFTDALPVENFLAVLSSPLVRYLIKNYINHTVHTQVEGLKPVPINLQASDILRQMRDYVGLIVAKQKNNPRYSYHLHEQKEIDKLVYELYDLTEDDIREVKLWYCRRYPKLAEAQGVMSEVRRKYAESV